VVAVALGAEDLEVEEPVPAAQERAAEAALEPAPLQRGRAEWSRCRNRK